MQRWQWGQHEALDDIDEEEEEEEEELVALQAHKHKKSTNENMQSFQFFRTWLNFQCRWRPNR